MRLNEETIRAAMNRRLSALDADPRRRARIRERIHQEEEPNMNKRTQKILSLILTLVLAFSFFPAAFGAEVVDFGTCGEYLTWTLDSDGLLTIGGTGKMYHYSRIDAYTRAPWGGSAENIARISAVVILGS